MIELVKQDVYARTVINQHDQQYTRNDWVNPENAQNRVMESVATGKYTKSGTTYIKPHVLYAYDFPFSLPEKAVVTSLKFVVRMRCTSKLDAKAPIGLFVSYKKGIFSPDRSQGCPKKTGDCNGRYRIVPTEKISNSYENVTYEMPKANLKKFEDIHRSFTQDGFGIQLISQDSKTTGNVYIKYIRCIIEYELPQRYLTFNASSDSTNPTGITYGEETTLVLKTGNPSIASDNRQKFKIAFPVGLELVGTPKLTGDRTWFDPETMKWGVDGRAGKSNTMTMTVVPHATGLKEIRAFLEDVRWFGAYYFVESERVAGFDEILVTPHDLRRGEKSCFDVTMRSLSASTSYDIDVIIPSFKSNDYVELLFDKDVSSLGIELNTVNAVDGRISANFTVPQSEDFYLQFRVCYIPRVSPTSACTIQTPNLSQNFTLNIAEPYEKHVIFNTDAETGRCTQSIEFSNTRVVSQVEGDIDIMPIHVDRFDKDMYVDPSTFALNQWKKVRYIGCVEVPYAHYEPEHTSKDKLLDEHYKSKYYVGKENAVDEDISLKIRVPRKKTPTIIGLVNIDRPIPINLVPDAWEGDPLNHRGWAEIYGVKVKPTNPLYDDLDIDVKYITHNIISRFNIYRGDVIKEFELPNVLTESLKSGEDIGNFFNIDTDASFIYDADDITAHRNLFTFKNLQDITMKSKEIIASKSLIEIYWDSVKFDEIRENNIARFIRLVDDKDNVVFEYEYFDFDFSSTVYSCSVIGRVLTDNGYEPVINREIYLHSDVEFTDDEADEDYDDEAVDIYGSSVSFELNNNKLTVQEKGFSGYEYSQTVTLPIGNYYLEVYTKNNNNDADTGNTMMYFNIEVSELTYDTVLSQYYKDLVVSPYPVPYKKIVFTRESEEGTIYYLENDKSDFSFLLEPFYQYKCGVDLTAEGISIFDFNNSFPVIYIQNGLIRFGINRLNGDLYLDKWDYFSRKYIRTNRFRIDKFDDAEITKINDDIIVANISDITITMWRGRPYVMLQHENEDIHMLDTFTKAFADGIGDNEPVDYPVIWNLFNSQNLLPECIGGTKLIKSSCITVTEEDPELEDLGDFTIVADKTECYVEDDVVCTFNEEYTDGEISLVLNGKVVGTNRGNRIYSNRVIPNDPTYQLPILLDKEGLNTIYAVYHGTETTNIEVSNVVVVNAVPYNFIEDEGWKIDLVSPKKMKYNEGTVDFKLTYNGSPVRDYEMLVSNPHQTWHWRTNENGLAKTPNNQVVAGKHTWIASVYENGELLAQKKVKITVSANQPKIIAVDTNIKRGGRAVFKLVSELKTPIVGEPVDITISDKKYVRTTNEYGHFKIKLKGGEEGRTVEYTANIKYVGAKNKYKTVSRTVTITCGAIDGS